MTSSTQPPLHDATPPTDADEMMLDDADNTPPPGAIQGLETDTDAAPSKAEFLEMQGVRRRGAPASSLHTSTYSVALDTSASGTDDGLGSEDGSTGGSVSAPPSRAWPEHPASPGAQSKLRRQIYGLASADVDSPEGSTLALPYGTSRSNSVETFATFSSEDARRAGYDLENGMLEDPH